MLRNVLYAVAGTLMTLPGLLAWRTMSKIWFGVPVHPTLFAKSNVYDLAYMVVCYAGLPLGSWMGAYGVFELLEEMDVVLPFGPADRTAAGLIVVGSLMAVMYLRERSRFIHRMEDPMARCVHCDYPLRGLRPRRGALRCPECGHAESIRDVAARLRIDLKQAKDERRPRWHQYFD